jgi:hypothetical protein
MILYAILLFVGMVVIGLLFYVLLLPIPDQPVRSFHSWEKFVGRGAYGIAYVLSLLRAPLGLLPYMAKLFIFFALNIRYESAQSTYFREGINMVGDIVNLALTTVCVQMLVGSPRLQPLAIIFYLPIGAELVRLITERVPITFSAVWQLLPHRRWAQSLMVQQHAMSRRCFAHYCRYYALGDAERAAFVLNVLKQRATDDKDMTNRLSYITAFRIIPQHHGLRSGNVRDVAQAEVFIHAIWTNDPWLLIGMALRRAPWMFDPRYLRRPFYYMSEANRLATLFVLEHARYSLPYAVFQFGHEIRGARLHLFYGLLRWLGLDVEYKVNMDGIFQFDQWICWLQARFGHCSDTPQRRSLYTDDEVIADLLLNHITTGEVLSAEQIAVRYTYPVKYVEEVLMAKINGHVSLAGYHT